MKSLTKEQMLSKVLNENSATLKTNKKLLSDSDFKEDKVIQLQLLLGIETALCNLVAIFAADSIEKG
jgi:hypothetical protein